MIKLDSADLVVGFIEDNSIGDRARRQTLSLETSAEAETCRQKHILFGKLMRVDAQVGCSTPGQIPSVSAKLMFNMCNKASWTCNMDMLLSTQQHAKKTIEADKMIHVGMADKDMSDAQKRPRRYNSDIA